MRTKLVVFLASLALFGVAAWAQAVPGAIAGRWRIVRILPTKNPACWDASQARTLVGTILHYEPQRLTWRGGSVPITDALTRNLSSRRFQDEYKVDPSALDLRTPFVQEIDLQHEDADITGATTEVPGDTVLVAGPGRIVVSACGVFYSAVRVTGAH